MFTENVSRYDLPENMKVKEQFSINKVYKLNVSLMDQEEYGLVHLIDFMEEFEDFFLEQSFLHEETPFRLAGYCLLRAS